MSTLAAARPARARLGRWPFDDEVVHLVLLDHHMVPTAADVAGWLREATEQGARAVRTGALFPDAVPPFLDAGFRVADRLALLAAPVAGEHPTAAPRRPAATTPIPTSIRLRRLRPSMLAEASTIDRRAFASPWANDVPALADIMTATPYHRSRSIHVAGRMVAFSISGRADRTGYVQRLAVDPSARRQGLASLLLDDARRWMQRRHVTRVMVNTAEDNRAALALYESFGFARQPGSLQILERTL
ncbi:MAG: GNAT family N-acetyltransferase [Acidobacteriota bacterium]